MNEIQRILVPTDFSECSTDAISRASCLADKSQAELHLLHVSPPSFTLDSPDALREDKLRRSRERLNQLLHPHAELKLTVQREAREGSPPAVIHDYAQDHDIDLIVMGTHGRTGLAHAVLGSVAEKVLRSSPCPVLVVQPTSKHGPLPLQSAVEALHEHFGDTLAGDQAQTRSQMKGRLAKELEVSDTLAVSLVEKLESLNVLSWCEESAEDDDQPPTEGYWQINPTALQSDEPTIPTIHMKEINQETAPAIDLIQRALVVRATDVHIDPKIDGDYAVRFRIDGRMEPYCELDREVAEHLTHQLRMLGNLEIVDRFHAQEGRLRLPSAMAADLEVRITTSPVAGGDATALRLFSRENVFLPLSRLGFDEASLQSVERMLRLGEGIVLITGPTGTGKTTTVYSMLEYLGSSYRNIVSIEDPVEFAAPFVRQMSVDDAHGITMSSGLRTLLRMDPDIIFLGEVRDQEAAEIAMRAAASGRHVFSTLHTRDVAATITALRDLYVDKRSLAGNLRGIVNQRLLRRLCTHCCDQKPLSGPQREHFLSGHVEPPTHIKEPVGCDRCRGTGYRGRIGVFEVAVMFDELAVAIVEGSSEDRIRKLLRSHGSTSLTSDALNKVASGVTSYREAIEMHWI